MLQLSLVVLVLMLQLLAQRVDRGAQLLFLRFRAGNQGLLVLLRIQLGLLQRSTQRQDGLAQLFELQMRFLQLSLVLLFGLSWICHPLLGHPLKRD